MNQDATGSSIFEGITVVDCSSFVTGGFATLMLANQGAEVIKVERPEVGDDIRHSGPPFVEPAEHDGPGTTVPEGESPYYWTVNYDKRSIELNLKSAEAVATLYDLIETADVFVENFRPGTADRLGLGYEDLSSVNDELIYCSISAFGETGPWSDRPGYDLLVQGASGLMSVTGEADGPPVKVGIPQTDLITGMWAAFGVAGALYRRERTGEGERVELGMLDATLPWLTKQAGKAFLGEEPTRMGTRDPVLAPYQTFPTADGHLNVACGNQKLWTELCTALDREALAEDERFETMSDRVTNMDALEAELSAEFQARTTEEWVEELAVERGIPVGPINSVGQALDNPQVEARGVIGSVEHPTAGTIPTLEHPLNFEHSTSGFHSPPPLLGEDTEAVLRELGYDDEQIDALIDAGAIPDR